MALLNAITIVGQIHTFTHVTGVFFFQNHHVLFPVLCMKTDVLSINTFALSLRHHLSIFLFTYRNVSFTVFKGSRTSDKIYIYKLSVIFWAMNTGSMNTWNCKNVSLHLCLEMFLLHLWLIYLQFFQHVELHHAFSIQDLAVLLVYTETSNC